MTWGQDLFPFQNLSNAEILDLSYYSNTDCLCSAQLARAKLDSLPRFHILTAVSNVPLLPDLGRDLQIPSRTISSITQFMTSIVIMELKLLY